MSKIVLWITGTPKPISESPEDILIEVSGTDFAKIDMFKEVRDAINNLARKL